MTCFNVVTIVMFVGVCIAGIPSGFAGWGYPSYGGIYGGYGGLGGYPGWGGMGGLGGYSSSNALGGGQIGFGNINTDNTAFSQGGMGFAHGNTNAQGYGANIFSAASSSSMGNGFWRRRR
ncbi:uncharacterized protein LOC129585885 isoform X2 [Paramacrobiotus metropolitanus]|uniref:uncharacterized protein LOC129585885 isoform X2 n=1 Tax=Paramacrobiotus metropolitanus TaxID=2943436 RepID=UPI00244587A7|nr:uncharacterized protein LOC129585885 isoform X2 [Paramacrobiotus metropolitanus]